MPSGEGAIKTDFVLAGRGGGSYLMAESDGDQSCWGEGGDRNCRRLSSVTAVCWGLSRTYREKIDVVNTMGKMESRA